MNVFWLFFLLLAILFLPISKFSFFVLPFEFSKFVVFYFFGIVLLFILGVFLLKETRIIIPDKKIIFPLVIFVIFYFTSTVFSLSALVSTISYFGSFTGGFIYVLFLLVFFYSAFVLSPYRRLIIQTLFLSGFLVAIYGLWQYLGNFYQTKEFVFRIYSTIGQPNRLAFFLLAIFPLGLFLFWEEKRNLLKIIYGFGLVIILVAFLLTFSRSSYAILILLFLLMGYFFIPSRNAGLLAMTQKILSLFIVICLLLFGFLFAKTIPSTINNFSQSSLALRLAEWQGSLGAVIDRPWWRQLIGFGPETSYLVFFKHRPEIYNQNQEEYFAGPLQIRNYYLHLLSGIGVLGLLAYLYLLKQILDRAWEKGKTDSLSRGIFFSLLGISLYSFFYYQTDVVLVVFWILTGLVVLPPKFSNYYNVSKHYSNMVVSFLIILVVMVLSYNLYRVVLAHYYASQNPSEFNFTKAVELNSFLDVYKRNLSKFYMSEMMQLKDIDKNLAQEKFLLSQKYAQQAVELLPLDIRNIRQLLLTQYFAGVHLSKKYHQGNIELAQQLVRLSPSDPSSWDFLGLVHLDLGQLEEAKMAFSKEKTLSPYQPGVYLHLGEVAKQQGKILEAIEFYKTAVNLSRGWDFAQKELEKAQKLLPKK